MQTLKEVARASRYQAMQPAAITERQALDAAIYATTKKQAEDIVLHRQPRRGLIDYWHDCVAITVYGTDYHPVAHFQRNHDGDTPWIWYGHESMKDQLGRKWKRQLKMVCDDFGNLVEVAS